MSISGNFQYTILSSDYNDSDTPIINIDGSFTTLNKTISVVVLDTTVTYEYVFTDNGTTNDGLYLYNIITTTTDMTINTFDNIPLSRSGSNFRDYEGNFPTSSTDIPTLLSGTFMRSMFYDATNFNQEIDSWDISSATTLRDLFHNSALIKI